MTREIKFKGWHKKIGEMANVESIFSNGYVHLAPISKISTDSKMFKLDEVELLQFTGLKDKNGKEIYEGDILRLHCGGEDGATSRNKVTATVEWLERGFIAAVHDKKVIVKGGTSEGKELSMREIHTWCGMHHCLTSTWISTEVVGNIYENPELMK